MSDYPGPPLQPPGGLAGFANSLRPPSQGANPWSDAVAHEALRLIGRYFLRAVTDATSRPAPSKRWSSSVPARIVTGYQGGERNTVDGFWVVRQSDAHAWTEVWLTGRGWVRVDPTSAVAPGRTGSFQRLQAPRGVIATAFGTVNPNLAASMRAAWEALNNSWNQWVLNYTQSKQLDLLKNLGFQAPSWEDLAYVLLGLLVFVALCGAAWTLWERRQHDPWLRLLARTRKRLHAAGLDLPPAAPPRQIATLVTGRFGEGARSLADWLLKLEMQRYARAPEKSLAALQREFKHLAWPG